MSLVDRFLPPPGAPGAVRDAAACWRHAAADPQTVGEPTEPAAGRPRGQLARAGETAFAAAVDPFLAALAAAVHPLARGGHRPGAARRRHRGGAGEYHQRMLAVGLTAAAGVLLTPLTLTGSDEAAAAAIGAELAAATELATGAAEVVLGVLAAAADQAVALAARWVVLSGAAVGADAAGGAIVHGPRGVINHLHLGDDLELALVGAVAVPIGAELSAALGGGGAMGGVSAIGGVAGRLAFAGASLASADALVRIALRQGVDPGELAMMALPIGGFGRGATRLVPLGFAGEAEFAAFTHDLVGGLREAGYRDVVPVFQGSAVTGVKYTTGKPFDVGRRSDFDIALASPTLFERAEAAGVELRSRRTRTAPLGRANLERLGLFDLARRLSAGVERDVHFMIYPDLAGASNDPEGFVFHEHPHLHHLRLAHGVDRRQGSATAGRAGPGAGAAQQPVPRRVLPLGRHRERRDHPAGELHRGRRRPTNARALLRARGAAVRDGPA